MTLANKITLARIIFIPLAITLLLLEINGLALVVFLFLSFSDVVDGYIARRFNQVSDLGKILDPLADKILVISTLIALVGLGKAHPVPVMIIACREIIVSGLRMEAARSNKIISATGLAKWKTASQVLAIAMLIIDLPLANLTLWVSVILSLISGGDYLWQSSFLKKLKLK